MLNAVKMTHAHGGDEMEIIEVERETSAVVTVGRPIRISFHIIGALGAFEFPFSNESLTENKIIFVKGMNVNV